MSKDFMATIRKESPRAEAWEHIFGSREIVLRSPIAELASAPGVESAFFYQLDLQALTEEQRARLIAYLAEKFHLALEEVASTLDEVGCPILAEDVFVTVFNPQRWL